MQLSHTHIHTHTHIHPHTHMKYAAVPHTHTHTYTHTHTHMKYTAVPHTHTHTHPHTHTHTHEIYSCSTYECLCVCGLGFYQKGVQSVLYSAFLIPHLIWPSPLSY